MNKLFFCLILFSLSAQAQKQTFTMKQAVLGLYTDLKPDDIRQLDFLGSSDLYGYIETESEKDVFYSVNPSDGVKTPLLTLDEINEVFQKLNLKEEKRMPGIQWLDAGSFYLVKENKFLHFRKEKNRWIAALRYSLPEDISHEETERETLKTVFVKEHNIYIASDGETVQVTTDGNENIVYGEAVHRNEFGIDRGYYWSPKGNALAYYRMDQTMVSDYPIINWEETPATVKTIKYPMAGGTSHQVRLAVYHLNSDRHIFLDIDGPKDQYLTSVCWSPDEQSIYVGVLNRDQNHCVYKEYSARTGQYVRTLFEESSDVYVEPQHPFLFLKDHPDQFVAFSQRDGYMHLYLYNKKGMLIRQLTKGEWVVNEILGQDAENIYFTSTRDGAKNKNIYSVRMANGQITRLSGGEGYHQAKISESCHWVLDYFQNKDIPREIRLYPGEYPQKEKILLHAGNTLKEYATPRIENKEIIADDGTILYGRLMYPMNFNPKKKYPCIVYLYNGPHVQLIRNTFPESGNLWYDYMTQHGYFVFVMDGRGSSNRGLLFENATFQQLGTVEMEDQLKGVDLLTKHPNIDAKRLGVHGWSFGGFMTTSLMLRHPGVFKVGVAGGPVIDWSMYEIMYTERYMDTPQDNPEGYKESNLLDKVENLQGKLLIIHGAQDDVVVWQHSMKLIRESVKAGKQIDYFVYPKHPHNVRGADRVHLMQKVTDYFDLYLK